MISGVLLTPLQRIEGIAGDVLHALKSSAQGYAGFGEAYFSEIRQGAIKSWRRHRLLTVNLVVPIGRVRFAIHDDASGLTESYELGAHQDYTRLTISPGLWFSFQGKGTGVSLILSVIDREHDPLEVDTCALDSIPFVW